MAVKNLVSCDVIGCTHASAWTRTLTLDEEHLCHLCWSQLRLRDPATAWLFANDFRPPQLESAPQNQPVSLNR